MATVPINTDQTTRQADQFTSNSIIGSTERHRPLGGTEHVHKGSQWIALGYARLGNRNFAYVVVQDNPGQADPE